MQENPSITTSALSTFKAEVIHFLHKPEHQSQIFCLDKHIWIVLIFSETINYVSFCLVTFKREILYTYRYERAYCTRMRYWRTGPCCCCPNLSIIQTELSERVSKVYQCGKTWHRKIRKQNLDGRSIKKIILYFNLLFMYLEG